MRGIIAAVASNGVIGVDGKLPWRYPEDLKRFKRHTLGSTVIMGRKTWESMGGRPLPGRRNIVVTSRWFRTGQSLDEVERYPTIPAALESVADQQRVWFIGGARVYREAMPHCDRIDLTYTPDWPDGEGVVRFPDIPRRDWIGSGLLPHPDPRLSVRIFLRRDIDSR